MYSVQKAKLKAQKPKGNAAKANGADDSDSDNQSTPNSKALKAKIDQTVHIMQNNQGNLDSGTYVWAPNVHVFNNIEQCKCLGEVELANGTVVTVKGIGDLLFSDSTF
ncbi:hypothetical protein BJ742DRAFT_736361 [Cladochytrium replicatum]|nr:hypothetical protein BJ742DRAFT_736361 [Cladochytrium replicatum]